MTLTSHIISIVPVACLAYGETGSLAVIAGLVMGGILIDVDHVLEFWYDNRFSLNLSKFFSYCNSGINSRFFIFFHSYEIVIPLLILSHLGIGATLCQGIIIGFSLHMVLDYVNILRKYNYRWYSFIIFSMIFRSFYKFNREAIDLVVRHPGAS